MRPFPDSELQTLLTSIDVNKIPGILHIATESDRSEHVYTFSVSTQPARPCNEVLYFFVHSGSIERSLQTRLIPSQAM
jgi:hypothetical protein